MAFLLPENLGSRSDIPQAVREVAAVFRDFVDQDVTVWLEHADDDPYLVVFDPQHGIVFVHVVQGGARSLVKQEGRLLKRPVPVEWDELVAALGPRLREAEARLGTSTRLDKQVPVAVTAAIPSADRAAMSRAGYVDSDAFLLKEDFQPNALRAALARVVGGGGLQLTERQEREVRAKLHPEIVIRDSEQPEPEGQLMFRPPADHEGDVIAVLDREQERLARHLGDGYRVIKGVAGSGKTLVLTFRSRFLATGLPHDRILLACYNKPLAVMLGAQLRDIPNITVSTVDSLASQVCRHARLSPGGTGDERFRLQREAALKAVRKRPESLRFSAVMLDEAQDLDDTGTELAWSLLDDGADQFLVALDAAQNIYRKQSRWTPEGTSGRGRTKLLRLNYRNTREILDVAYRFLQAGSSTESLDAELDDPHVIVPPEATARRGTPPSVVQCASADDAFDTICRELKAAHAAGTKWSDMAVLIGNKPARTRFYFATKRHGIPYFDVSHGRNRAALATAGDEVRGSTFQGLKGLEFQRVFLTGLDDIQAGKGADDETRRRLVYVGMTRATDHLSVAAYGRGPIVSDLLSVAG